MKIPNVKGIEQEILEPSQSGLIHYYQENYINTPTSTEIDLMLKAFQRDRKSITQLTALNHNKKYEVKTYDEGMLLIEYDYRKNSDTRLSFIDEFLPKSGKHPVNKILTYILTLVFDSFYGTGRVFTESEFKIQFKLSDLVELKCYSDVDSARVGIDKIKTFLRTIGIEYSKDGNKTGVVNLINQVEISNNECSCWISNKPIVWGHLLKNYYKLPRYAYSLSAIAFNLFCFLCSQARFSLASIKEKGFYSINITAIQNHLGLNDKTKNPKRDYILKIDKALNEIETISSEDLRINTHYDTNESISDFKNRKIDIYPKDRLKDQLLRQENRLKNKSKRRRKTTKNEG